MSSYLGGIISSTFDALGGTVTEVEYLVVAGGGGGGGTAATNGVAGGCGAGGLLTAA